MTRTLDETDPADDPIVVAMQRRLEARLFGRAPEPVRVGRFALRRILGSGAMGVVHLAHDEVLDREIAVKLIRGRTAGLDGARSPLREAQAMARLSHTNVVHVYEAGEYTGGFFVAMELVEGVTLRTWLEGEGASASWRERLDMVVGAGRGLAEAHRAGVTHRDFKPDNVLIDARGVPKVSDFGLAGLMDGTLALADTATDLDQLACTAGAVGTPLYMAPEVFDGRPATARSDQFSFCVTAYEAVHGIRPFAGNTFEALSYAVTSGHRRATPRSSASAAVLRAIDRGLSLDPNDRWPSMDELVAALTAKPRELRWRAAAGLALSGCVVLGGLAWSSTTREEPACGDAAEHLTGVWDGARREQLGAALGASEVPFAGDTWARVGPQLDEYAQAWIEQRGHACELTRVHHEQSEAVLELRRRCLDVARTSLAATVDTLVRAEPEAIAHASELVAALPPLSRCEDVVALEQDVAPPEAERERVDALDTAITEAEVTLVAGDHAGALAQIERAIEGLEGLSYQPIATRAQLVAGAAHLALQQEDAAELAFRRALQLALANDQWELALDAASQLAFELGARQYRFGEAAAQLDVAQGLLARGATPHLTARFHVRRAGVLHRQARYPEAIEAFRVALEAWPAAGDRGRLEAAKTREQLGQALLADGQLDSAETEVRAAKSLLEELVGVAHPAVVHAQYQLGIVLTEREQYEAALAAIDEALRMGERIMPGDAQLALIVAGKSAVLSRLGRNDDAIAMLQEALQRFEPTLGAEHRATISLRQNLAGLLLNMGRLDEAEPHLRQALRAGIALYGADHPSTADLRNTLGVLLDEQGRYAEAEAELRAALATLRERLGDRHLEVGRAHASVADSLAGQNRLPEAAAEYRAAVAILEAELGPQSFDVGKTRNNLATVLVNQGQLADAEIELLAARAAFEALLPPHHEVLVITNTNLGENRLAQDDAAGALPSLERAVAAIDDRECPPRARADARRALARALHLTGGDRDRIRGLLEAALVDYRRLPPRVVEGELEPLEAWLKTGRPSPAALGRGP